MGSFLDNKFKIIIIVILVVLILTVAGGGFFVWTILNRENTGETVEYVPDNLAIWAIDEVIMANLSSGTGSSSSRIIRAGVTLGVDDSSKQYSNFVSWFEEKALVIRYEIIEIFRSQTYESVSGDDAGKRLGEEIKNSLNALFGTDIIYEVYFYDFLVQ